jgi:uncharacterized protein (DUF2236 family)
VIADPGAGVGGLRALFLQALHPRAMAGVDQHSRFPDDFWPRLRRTAEYVTTVTFGSADQADVLAARVRAVHQLVRGVDPVTGAPYRADDPELLCWVHVSEVSSFLEVAVRAGLRLSPAEADRYYAEQTRAAALLGADDVPGSVGAVAAYLAEVRPRLRASVVARRAAVHLLLPPLPTRIELLTPARPAWAVLAGLAFGLQPAWARRLYGVPVLPGSELSATLALRTVRATALAARSLVRSGHSPIDAGRPDNQPGQG